MDKVKNILVVGGAGYIGCHVVQALCDLGHLVTVLDNFSTGLKQNVDSMVDIIEGDILNLSDLQQAFTEPVDVVFHFAALKAAGESMEKPEKYSTNNISGTINLLNCMQEHNIKNFVFSSSAAVYGEPQYLPIDENHPLNPINYYGYTKLAIEQILHWYSSLKGIHYASLRYFNATGYDINGRIKGREQNPANLTPIVMEVAAGMREKMQVFGNDYSTPDGFCIRDFIHVNDLADAHLLAMDYICDKKQNLVLNLGTGQGYSVMELINSAELIGGKKINYEITTRRSGDPPELVANSKLAEKKINWKAKYSDLDTIIKTMCQVYL